MHYLYIIHSKKTCRFYIGQSANVENRLGKHNKGHSNATKHGVPWELKRVIEFDSKSEAIKAENWLKRMKSRRLIEQITTNEIDLY